MLRGKSAVHFCRVKLLTRWLKLCKSLAIRAVNATVFELLREIAAHNELFVWVPCLHLGTRSLCAFLLFLRRPSRAQTHIKDSNVKMKCPGRDRFNGPEWKRGLNALWNSEPVFGATPEDAPLWERRAFYFWCFLCVCASRSKGEERCSYGKIWSRRIYLIHRCLISMTNCSLGREIRIYSRWNNIFLAHTFHIGLFGGFLVTFCQCNPVGD